MTPLGTEMYNGATYMTKRRGEMREPRGVPADTGAVRLGEPCNTMVQVLAQRKEEIQSTMLEEIALVKRDVLREGGSTFSKPALMSRKSVETLSLGLWRLLTS